MAVIPDSQMVYDFLIDRCSIGHVFMARDLHRRMKDAEVPVTYSALTAFITRAVKAEMLAIDKVGERGVRIYKLISKPGWNHGSKSIGSKPGRTIHKEPVVDSASLPVSEIPNVSMIFGPSEPLKLVTLSDMLINIAADVERLENKPEKQLSDYTIDELMEELKRRVR